MGFFERTPLGRILNRFSSDVASMDTVVPETAYMVAKNMTSVLASVVVMTGTTTPYSIILWLALAVMYTLIQVIYAD